VRPVEAEPSAVAFGGASWGYRFEKFEMRVRWPSAEMPRKVTPSDQWQFIDELFGQAI
jgi:hypothetical protein